jgi:hypothetical protein
MVSLRQNQLVPLSILPIARDRLFIRSALDVRTIRARDPRRYSFCAKKFRFRRREFPCRLAYPWRKL